MDQRLNSYLRSLRRRGGFTQRELAFLIGTKSGTVISRVEGSKRIPSFSAAFACAVIFGVAPLDLFPDALFQLQQAVLQRANTLYEVLQGDPAKTTRVKLDFLEVLIARLEEDTAADV
jgi:transcriptional regulator with XRE-family HTH domain